MDSHLPALPSPEPAPASAPDPATAAFTRLETEIGVLRRLIESTDPSPTLAEMRKDMDTMREETERLAGRPAMKLTPDAMAGQIAAAGKTARAEDSAAITQARDRIDKVAARMERLAGTVATVREQRRHLAWAAGGGMVAGMLLWSALPGAILRALPQGWHMPENMARHIIGEPTLWDTGARLMRTDSPEAWTALTEAATMLHDNREAIEACRRGAGRTRKPVRCAIEIRPGS
jgi:hypothetical protein